MKKLIPLIVFLALPGMLWSQGMQVKNTFRANKGAYIHMNGNLTVESGNLILNHGTTLIMGDGDTLSVNPYEQSRNIQTSNIRIFGNEADSVKITSLKGWFVFLVNKHGTISAEHAIFERMKDTGLVIQPEAVIDALNNCTFRSGAEGSTFLTINNNQELEIYDASFIGTPTDNGFSESWNVRKTVDQGKVTFLYYSGDFAGPDNEYDPYIRIFWTKEGVPIIRYLDDVMVVSDTCYDAMDTIFVQNFTVNPGASVNLIAGKSILFFPGVLVQYEGSLHAYISTDFCHHPEPLIASREVIDHKEEIISKHLKDNFFISIYPNPTTGRFTVEIKEDDENDAIALQIYGMLGELIHSAELAAGKYEFDLSNRQPGFYLVRAVTTNKTQTIKIIKQ